MFTTNPILLNKLLDEVDSGEMQLPEFQRGWIWNDQQIKDLLTSILMGYPIGAIMRLESGGNFKFKPRPIEGASGTSEPSSFILDGQQRMTSLYQSLIYPGPVDTHDTNNRKVKRWYYIDMSLALKRSSLHEEFIISVPGNKIQTKDFGRTEELNLTEACREYEKHLFPTDSLFNSINWILGYIGYWDKEGRTHPEGSARDFVDKFNEQLINEFQRYSLPVIELKNDLPLEAVCLVFEKVNTGGVALNIFDLLTASLAAEGFDLREDWERRNEKLMSHDILKKLSGDQFLQAVTLLATYQRHRDATEASESNPPGVGCTRRDILSLNRAEYEKWADHAEKGFEQAVKFLKRQYIFNARDLPYVPQLISIAVIYVEMGVELEPADSQSKLERWYWSGVFGENYSGTTETRMANDLRQVPDFVRPGSNGTFDMLEESSFLPERLLSLRTRNSAAYKGLHALQMKSGAKDWRTGEDISMIIFDDEKIDIHHIFPVAWCKNRASNTLGMPIPSRIYNSAINKAPLSARTNRTIGSREPSRYIPLLRKGNKELDTAIRSSNIDPKILQSNDFAAVFVNRGMALMSMISDAMGRDLLDGKQIFEDALRSENLQIQVDEYDD